MEDFEQSIGVSFSTDSAKKAATDLNDLAEAMERVEVTATQAEKKMEETARTSGEVSSATAATDAAFQALASEMSKVANLMAQLVGNSKTQITATQGTTAAVSGLVDQFENLGRTIPNTNKPLDDYSAHIDAARRATQELIREQNSFLASLRTQADTLGMTRTEMLALKASQLGIADQAAGDIAKIKAFENGIRGVGKAAGLTGQEMINVGYQVQDFLVQIASGQNVLVAGAQQGSQLSGVFQVAAARGVSFSEAMKSIGAAAGGLVVALAPVLVAVGAVAGTFALFAREVNKVGDSKKLLESLDLTEKQMDRLKKKGTDLSFTLGDTFNGIGYAISKQLSGGLDAVLNQLGTSTAEIKKVVGEALDFIGKTIWEKIRDPLAATIVIGKMTVEAFHDIWNASKSFLEPIGAVLKGAFDAVGETLGDLPKLAMDPIRTLLGLFGGLSKAIPALFKNFPAVFVDIFVTAFNAAGKMITDFVNKNRNVINAMLKAVGVVMRIPVPEIPELNFTPWVNSAQGAAAGIVKAFKDGAKETMAEFDKTNAGLDKWGNGVLGDVRTGRDKSYIGRVSKDAGEAEADKKTKDRLTEQEKAIKRMEEAQARLKGEIAQATARQNELNAAYAKGGEAAVNALQEQFDLMDANKDAFAAILPYQEEGVTYTKEQKETAEKLLQTLTKEVIARKQIAAASDLARQIDKEAFEYEKRRLALKEGGVGQYEAMAMALDLMRQNKDLSEETALAEAKRLLGILKQNEALEKQYARMKDISEETAVKASVDELEKASDDFWFNLVSEGGSAFKTLGDDLKAIFQRQAAAGLREGFEPVLDWLKTEFKKTFSDIFSTVKGALQGALEKIGVLKKNEDGTYSLDKNSFGGKAVAYAAQTYAAYQMGSSIGGSLSSAAGGMQSKNQQQNSQIGGGIGAILGSFAGPIGSIIGSAIGSFVGGLLGPSSTNAAASSILDASGKSTSGVLGTKRTDQTTSALNTAITALQAGYKSITDLGGTMSIYVRNLEIGQRDQSRVDLSNGQTVFSAVGDSGAAANAGLLAVLKGTVFDVDALNKIKDGMIEAGASFDDTYTTIASVKQALDANKPALSEWGQKLKQLTDVFTPLIQKTGAYSTAAQDAFNAAKGALAESFNTDISKQLLAANSQAASQYATMLETQAQRVKDATEIGGDLAKVMALNAKEMENFISSMSNAYSSISDLNAAFTAMIEQARKAGEDTAPLTAAYEKAKGTLRDQFNTSTADSLLQASNATLYNLEQLLKQQKKRVEDATALGANLAAVNRLNAIETSNFFKNLSETEKLQLGDYLGLIEDYTGKIGVVGAKLIDALDPLVNNLDEQIQTLKESSSNLRGLAKTIGDTSDTIKRQYGNVTPLAQISNLRTQFKDTAALAIGGDQDALGKLSTLANELVNLSRDLYGSSTTFGADYDLVTSLLDQAKASATAGADKADAQIVALNSQIDLLKDIKNILGDSTPNLDALAIKLGALDGTFTDLKALLGQYVSLSVAQQGAVLSDAQLQTLSYLISSRVANTTAVTQAASTANATTGQTTGQTTASTVTTAAANDVNAADVAGYFQMLQKTIAEMSERQKNYENQILTLNRQLLIATQNNTIVKSAG